MITSNPFDGGKFTMKSMDTILHGLSRISNGRNNPILLVSQTIFQIFLPIVFQIRPIVGFVEECYGAFCATMAHKGPIMTLLKEHIFKFPFWNIKPILLIP